MADFDERLLRAITGQNGVESHLEVGDRREPDSDVDSDRDSDDEGASKVDNQPVLNTAENRAMSDAALRQYLDIGGAKTGPKGVMADYKFHQRQEKARRDLEQQRILSSYSIKGMKSGWLARQVANDQATNFGTDAEEIEPEELLEKLEADEEDEYLKEYRAKRLSELASASRKQRFGQVIELTSEDDYLSAVDDEAPDTVVVVHLYQNQLEECRVVNGLLEQLAERQPFVKYCKIQSHLADAAFDQVALPALLSYCGGVLKGTVMRALDECPTWKKSGICTAQGLEEVLVAWDLLDAVASAEHRLGGLVIS
ncbi:thioredoxin-like protein [Phlyctochytrium arcticum]|nr:thioredoxin-like protein [Phlyctochytrium arcticum]